MAPGAEQGVRLVSRDELTTVRNELDLVPAKPPRANYIGAPAFFDLNQACRVIVDAYGCCLYLVGSSLVSHDFRDVDLRLILSDEAFDALFPGVHESMRGAPARDARWSLMCSAIAMYLSARSGLPIDFQIQRQTEANAMWPGPRHAVGIFTEPRRDP